MLISLIATAAAIPDVIIGATAACPCDVTVSTVVVTTMANTEIELVLIAHSCGDCMVGTTSEVWKHDYVSLPVVDPGSMQ